MGLGPRSSAEPLHSLARQGALGTEMISEEQAHVIGGLMSSQPGWDFWLQASEPTATWLGWLAGRVL